jgi:hypothetical protein
MHAAERAGPPRDEDAPVPPAALVAETVALTVERAALSLGASCLVESRDGRLAAHSIVGDIPAAAISAVLSRTSLPLQSASGRLRTIAVVPGGGVQSVDLRGWDAPVVRVPLTSVDRPLGWLWVLCPAGGSVDLPLITACATDIARAAVEAVAPHGDPLTAALFGWPGAQLPAGLSTDVAWHWVVAARDPGGSNGRTVAGLLELAVRRGAARGVRTAVTSWADTAYLVVASRERLPDAVVLAAVDAVRAQSGLPLRAGCSDAAPAAGSLECARVQADETVCVATEQRPVLCLASARPAIVLRYLSTSLQDLPDLGLHPLQRLLAYDRKNGGDLAPTLLAWLDAQGDRLLTATLLKVHHNTVRYRVKRACALLGLDLQDATARLELHVRLRAELAVAASRGLS